MRMLLLFSHAKRRDGKLGFPEERFDDWTATHTRRFEISVAPAWLTGDFTLHQPGECASLRTSQGPGVVEDWSRVRLLEWKRRLYAGEHVRGQTSGS